MSTFLWIKFRKQKRGSDSVSFLFAFLVKILYALFSLGLEAEGEHIVSRTPIPNHLVHKLDDVERNAKLFDDFVSLVNLDPPELREIIAASLLEQIRQKVLENGKFKLPFGLIVTEAENKK